MYYSKDKGARIDFGQDRVKIYKDGNVTVKDNISNKEYTMEEDMDKLHTIALMTNLLSFPMEEGSIEEGQEEWGDTQYIAFTSELFFENDHLDKIKVYVDKNEKVPLGAVIYDKDGKDRVRVIYKDFEKLKEMDDSIL
ncbi:Putative secreted protein [Clostridium chauvoei JF4335]|nr:Putative secreted protein [Clostridium chauvoei JF4335]